MSQALVLVPEEPKQEILDIKGAPELAERVEISSEDSQPKQLEEIIETPEQVYDTNEL